MLREWLSDKTVTKQMCGWWVAQVNRYVTPPGRTVQALSSAIRIPSNVWPYIFFIKLWVCTGMQGLRTNQKQTPAQGWRYTVVTFCLLLSWLCVISGWLLLFFSMLRLWVCQRRPAKLLTFGLRWKSDSCNSLECIRVFPEETLLSVFKTHFVVFRSGFSVLNSSFFVLL